MITPKILGVFLISTSLALIGVYLITHVKVILFYGLMFLLFGCACFKHINANVELLKGKTFFIYFSSPDLCRNVCQSLLDIGVYLIIGVRECDEISFDIKHKNLQIIPLPVDSNKMKIQINTMINKLNKNDQKLDGLLVMPTDAMNSNHEQVCQLNIDKFHSSIDSELVPKLVATQLLLPVLTESKGRILFITSYRGRISIPGQSVTCLIEHALESFCDCLRRELIINDIPLSLIEIPDIVDRKYTKSIKEILEALASACPKDRYLVSDGISLFDVPKLILVMHNFIPTSLVDSFFTNFPIMNQ